MTSPLMYRKYNILRKANSPITNYQLLIPSNGIIPATMKRYLLFTVFISGMTTLAAELAAGRFIGNVFGTSNIVWASIIGLILIYLTFGYFLGGKWADANPTAGAMYRILAWGAFTLGLVPFIAGPVLKSAATAFDTLQVGILGASFIAVLVLFIVPITLLGTISPYAIRLTVDDTSAPGKYPVRSIPSRPWDRSSEHFCPHWSPSPPLGRRTLSSYLA